MNPVRARDTDGESQGGSLVSLSELGRCQQRVPLVSGARVSQSWTRPRLEKAEQQREEAAPG